MNQLIHQLKSKKYLIPTFGLAVFVLVLIIAPIPAKADFLNSMGSALVSILSWLFMAFVNVMGTLLLKAIEILIRIANYGDFLNAPIVEKGWVVVRDVSNIALVIALLYMAFATVFRKSSYQYQNLLPKLVLAAILINFSKTITGLIIDLGQVFMMTFVNAFQSAAAGNLTYGFGLHDLLAFREAAGGGIGAGAGIEESINNWSIFGALVLGSLMVLVAFLVVLSLIIMLLMRILVLWFLVMFSPIAFMSGILPSEGGLSGYVNQWWSTLWKWVLAGPAVAFMLWLSLAVISEMTAEKRIISLSLQSAASQQGSLAGTEWQAFASKMSGTQNIVDYLVTTGLLIMCLVVASKTGVTGAKFAGTALAKMEGYGRKALSTAQRGAIGIAKLPTKPVGAAWRATKIPYAATAGLERLKTSGLGRRFGLDKEYKEEVAAGRKAWAAERVGAKPGAVAAFRYQEAQKVRKKLEEEGRLEGGEDAQRRLLRDFLAKGEIEKARAVMMNMAQDKEANLKTEDMDEYKKAVKFKPGTAEEKEYMKFAEGLMAMQKASGDVTAKYKFDVTRDSQGNLGYVLDRVKQVSKDFAEKKEADFNNVGLFKAFDEEKAEFRAILDELDKKKNMQALGTEGREKYANILQRMLARDADASDPFKLSAGEKTRYTNLLHKMHAKSFVRGTGEAILQGTPLYVAATAEQQRMADQAKIEFDIATDPTKLKEVAQKFQQKKAEKTREDIVHGREILTEVDKEVEERILAPMMIRNRIQPDLYKTANEDRDKDTNSFMTTLSTNLNDLRTKIYSNIGNGISNITYMDPVSRVQRRYSNVEVYKKSKAGQNMQTLDNMVTGFNPAAFAALPPEEQEKFRKDVENRIDMIVMSAQRAEGKVAEGRQYGIGIQRRGDRAIPESKRIENRSFNRRALGAAVNSVETLKTADLSQKERKKLINHIKSELNTANRHSKKWNADNEEFNNKLNSLLQDVEKLSTADMITLDNFKNSASELLGQVQAT